MSVPGGGAWVPGVPGGEVCVRPWRGCLTPSRVWCQSGGTLRACGFCCVCRKHLQEIPSSSSNVSTSFTWDWDASKTSEFLSGMGVSVLKKDKTGTENMPEDLLVTFPRPPKRQKVKDFFIARRPRLLQEGESGVSWDVIPDELLLAIFAYLPLNDLLEASLVCKRWRRLSFDESLWQSLDLTGRHLQPGVIGQLLPAGVIVFRSPRSFIGNPLFNTSKHLKVQHLDLSNCTVSVTDVQSILHLCEKLQNLSLEGLVLSDNITESIANNPGLIRLNVSGCSGFSAESLELMLRSCSMLEELNLSWCDFTATHVKAAVNHVSSKITHLNLSGYRHNLQIPDVKTLVERCPLLVHLDLRQLGEIPTLKTLQVFGLVTDRSLQLLQEMLPDVKINCSPFTTVARATVDSKKSDEIWGIKCRLTLRKPSVS
uniref:S-phase kinase associated protein 2 n=1 Tax=Strix occidentalis caurina TaxID=311401 RepID=A0A8D0END4_STROC